MSPRLSYILQQLEINSLSELSKKKKNTQQTVHLAYTSSSLMLIIKQNCNILQFTFMCSFYQ